MLQCGDVECCHVVGVLQCGDIECCHVVGVLQCGDIECCHVVGVFVCTDKDRNVILGSCNEYLGEPGLHYLHSLEIIEPSRK